MARQLNRMILEAESKNQNAEGLARDLVRIEGVLPDRELGVADRGVFNGRVEMLQSKLTNLRIVEADRLKRVDNERAAQAVATNPERSIAENPNPEKAATPAAQKDRRGEVRKEEQGAADLAVEKLPNPELRGAPTQPAPQSNPEIAAPDLCPVYGEHHDAYQTTLAELNQQVERLQHLRPEETVNHKDEICSYVTRMLNVFQLMHQDISTCVNGGVEDLRDSATGIAKIVDTFEQQRLRASCDATPNLK